MLNVPFLFAVMFMSVRAYNTDVFIPNRTCYYCHGLTIMLSIMILTLYTTRGCHGAACWSAMVRPASAITCDYRHYGLRDNTTLKQLFLPCVQMAGVGSFGERKSDRETRSVFNAQQITFSAFFFSR